MKEKLAALWSYISNQGEIIQSIFDKILIIKPSNEDKTIHVAYLLHNLYSAYEDIFKEVSYTFENNLEGKLSYHRDLLIKMTISVPGIRPRLLSEPSYHILRELMGFRHVFRHAYEYNLSPEKLEIIREKIINGKELIDRDIQIFKQFLAESFS